MTRRDDRLFELGLLEWEGLKIVRDQLGLHRESHSTRVRRPGIFNDQELKRVSLARAAGIMNVVICTSDLSCCDLHFRSLLKESPGVPGCPFPFSCMLLVTTSTLELSELEVLGSGCATGCAGGCAAGCAGGCAAGCSAACADGRAAGRRS